MCIFRDHCVQKIKLNYHVTKSYTITGYVFVRVSVFLIKAKPFRVKRGGVLSLWF